MITVLLILTALNTLLGILVLLFVLFRQRGDAELKQALSALSIHLENATSGTRDDLQRTRSELLNQQSELRTELTAMLALQKDSIAQESRSSREETSAALDKLNQQTNADAAKNREELGRSLDSLSESMSRKLQELTGTQQTQFEALKTALEQKMEQIRSNNETKLEQMRKTVDEKLHETLEKRLGDSFKQVSDRLEQVHKGLGEMQSLASGVGDLKRVLTNVKTRGVMGEIQLEMLLEQMLSPEQYVKNFKPNKRRDEVVEFAVRLPGRDEDQEALYLPIDAKFPIEDFNRLSQAWESGDSAAIEAARKALRTRIIGNARDIQAKYLNPPYTTDFALLFVPLEGLYAELLRDPELFELLRRQYHVILVGPTTFAAILNSLQMGFRTLAIEKRTGEVWKILSAVKSEFGKFGVVLDKTRKKLQEASNTIENASHRSRQIEKKLTRVESLPAEETAQILELESEFQENDETDADEDLT
ncbi:MAG TPA: DNA recombination protein RmuC [Candidatus Cloacimonadota bacterium]|jgi:DNA recombination protein RmuC|nr:DNA recombination protein RmuC [Candidatus Cloacimonadota bacterium]HOG31515.1 DNA recombination protein RmuC [Candidatus Cloacimonadota bacterium]HOR58877.1 DNA recombination protein RmuC [Candidatus Cloacimonadota bacterium]HPB08341.1 DNA recombination protein RmuC [Candidatus Cloacimonadota bacterium]HPL23815.1 DNA recombination protein RmuC [Candidatus Cloacimonadota bacterium]